MKNIFIIILLLVFTACKSNKTQQTSDIDIQKPTIVIDSVATTQKEQSQIELDELSQDEQDSSNVISLGGLNYIRFDDWTDEDWLDNDYIREIRKFFNAYIQEEINDERFKSLVPYRSLMNSKFVVLHIQPFLGGGVFMYIVFLDNPKQVFEAWVYGTIMDEDEGVIGYDIRLCRPSEEENNLSKNEILQIIKDNPKNKLWQYILATNL